MTVYLIVALIAAGLKASAPLLTVNTDRHAIVAASTPAATWKAIISTVISH